MSAVLAVARQGDRHTHAASVSDHDGGALLSVATGALVAAAGHGGMTTAALGAGVASGGGGGGLTLRDVIPLGTTGAVSEGSPRTLIGAGRLPAAVANAEPVDCHQHRDGPIRTGSASVFADGLRLARASDQTTCGATLCDGDPTVLVGGAPADGAPPDPLAVVAHGAALAAVAVSQALAAGMAAVETAERWGEALADRAIGVVEEAATTVESTAGAITAEMGAALGAAEDAASVLLRQGRGR